MGDWSELLAGDEGLTRAILKGMLHKARVFNIKRCSCQLRDLDHNGNEAELDNPAACRNSAPGT